ncbi:MAG: hypothetical protein ACI9UV_000701 [Algoriphagus sp.]|jgi:hypothetical protein
MLYRFGKAFYFLSLFGFIFFLLYFYSAMAESVGYSMDDNGLVINKISKETFFYSMIGIFVIFNALVLLPPKLLETKMHRRLHRIFPIGDDYRDYFLGWFYSFGGILNISLSIMVLYTHAINNQQEIAASKFNFFFYLIPALSIIWVIGLFIILGRKFKQIQQKSI